MEALILTAAQSRPSERRLSRPVYNPVVSIAGREISQRMSPYIVADIGPNHGGSLQTARTLIQSAKQSGADAVKLQTYTPAELTTRDHPDLWSLYERAQTPREWHRELFDYAASIGIAIFSSAFSVDGVKFLADLGAPAIKIASAEGRDADLIIAAMETGLPVIISNGRLHGPQWISGASVMLHCVARYPTKIEDSNLSAIPILQEYARGPVGLSDHTPGYETAIAATALGAVMIEKHFKLDDDCIDAAWSLDPSQFAAMCTAVRAIHAGMGDGVIRPTCEPRKR